MSDTCTTPSGEERRVRPTYSDSLSGYCAGPARSRLLWDSCSSSCRGRDRRQGLLWRSGVPELRGRRRLQGDRGQLVRSGLQGVPLVGGQSQRVDDARVGELPQSASGTADRALHPRADPGSTMPSGPDFAKRCPLQQRCLVSAFVDPSIRVCIGPRARRRCCVGLRS